jgi:hypothetical protein
MKSGIVFKSAKCSLLAGLVFSCSIYSADYTLNFSVDRSKLPYLNNNELTLKVNACGASSATVTANGSPVASMIANGNVVFTTDASDIMVTLTGATTTTGRGQFSKAALKYDRYWAWSIGIDDNGLDSGAISFMKKKGYRGTAYIIGNKLWMDDTLRDEPWWILARPAIVRLAKDNWGLGNHTWNHSTVPCGSCPNWDSWPSAAEMETAKQDVRLLDTFLLHCAVSAGKTNYKPIAFAAPVFDYRWIYVINDMKKNKDTKIQFDESGDSYWLRVDQGSTTEPSGSPASKFQYNVAIGRDWAGQEYGKGTTSDPKSKLDWIAANADETHHYWYNSLSHGLETGNGFYAMMDWMYSNYGEGATGTNKNKVWVAPAEEIYSYFLNRDSATVTYNSQTNSLPPEMSRQNKVLVNSFILAGSYIEINNNKRGIVRIFNASGKLAASFQTRYTAGKILWQAPVNGIYLVEIKR